jgi:methionyl-tRNA formyltransferase
MRAAFFGTPPAAVPALAALTGVAEVALVVTRPDKPRGRSGKPHPPSVKGAALDWGLQVAQPDRASDVAAELVRLDLDVAVVVAYGQLLRPDVLAVPRHGFVNLHFSLLPRWRGAAPVAAAILAGDVETGVTLMLMDEGLDTGAILADRAVSLDGGETAGALTAHLSAVGAALLTGSLQRYVAGELSPVEQNDALATRAPKLVPDDGRVTVVTPAAMAARLVRALRPRPGAWTVADGERLKLVTAAPTDRAVVPGTIAADGEGVLLGLADGALELRAVQPAGKPVMAAADWMNGRRNAPAVVE